jgi:hypothetical protein
MKPVYLLVPVGFDPVLMLPADLIQHADLARCFLHQIVCGFVGCRNDEKGFVPLMAKTIRPYFPSNKLYKRVRDALIEREVIMSDKHYVPGEKAIGYKFGPALAGRRNERVLVTNATLARKLEKQRARMSPKLATEVHRFLDRCLRQIEIDYPAALAALTQAEFEPRDEAAIMMIKDRQFFASVCAYGRFHSNLTNLKTSMRRFLTYGGQPLVNLDIRNSQPLFFGILLAEQYRPVPMPMHPDVRLYLDLVQAGQFYDHLMEAGRIPAAS